MSKDTPVTSQEKVLSVAELEKSVKQSPNDIALREDLASALLDRYLSGAENHDPGDEADIARLREILAKVLDESSPYARAYVAYLDSKNKEAADWLTKYARGDNTTKVSEPFTADELFWDIVAPFVTASKEFWYCLAESLGKVWPESAALLTIAGYASQAENKPEQAIENCLRALKKEPHYWIAAYQCAALNFGRQNWQIALDYYKRALESESARQIPDIYFDAAWSFAKLDKHTDAEKHYRTCLDLDEGFKFARNNLGWSLYSLGRFEEALAVFDDCIKRKVDGAYPRRNRARTLVKMGRLPEAIEAWCSISV